MIEGRFGAGVAHLVVFVVVWLTMYLLVVGLAWLFEFFRGWLVGG